MTSAAATSRRTAIILSVVVIAVLAAGTAVTITTIARHRRADRPRPATTALQTTTVVRRTLSNDLTVPGRLQYLGDTPLVGRGTGTVTELPKIGRIAERGTVLYRVDDQPVVAFFGDIPMFRELSAPHVAPHVVSHVAPGNATPPTAPAAATPQPAHGADVAMVAENLKQLGYFGGWFPADPHEMRFTSLLRTALINWQRAIGMAPTGKLDVGQVVVLPHGERVSAVTIHLGDPANGPIATMSSTRRVVSLSVPADQAVPIREHTPVRIVLASGRTIGGTVASIVAAPVTTQNAGGTPTPTTVTVTPLRQSDLGRAGTGPVQVLITTERRSNVLTVPIAALLALKGGTSYAVQLRDGRLIGVATGLFTADYVQITGPGLSAGMRVVTAT